jgi:hypothetical protein
VSDDAFPKITTDQLDEHADEARWLMEAPQGLMLEASFPGYLRMALVTHLANEWEERSPGAIRCLPKSLAVECAYVDEAIWLAINDPIGPSPEWLAARIAETGGKC